MINTNRNRYNRNFNFPQPFMIDLPDAAVLVGTGQTYNIPLPSGFMYNLRGMDVVIAGNQLFEGAFLGTAVAANQFIPAKTQRGAGVRLSKNKTVRYREFPLSIHFAAAGGGAGVNMMDDLEFPVGVTLTRAYWNAGTGTGAVAFTVDVTVGAAAAVEILNNAGANVVIMENEAINLNIPADTDVLIEFNDAGVATADQTLVLWFAINDEQLDYNENEFVPLTLHRGATIGAATVNIMDDLEFPENMIIRRAYAQVGIAPGGGFTVDWQINGIDLGCQIAAVAVIAENEALNLALPANVDNLVQIVDSGGASTDFTITLWLQRADPIDTDPDPPDLNDVYGDVWVPGNTNIVIQYDQGTTLQQIRTVIYGSRMPVRA